MPDKKLRKLSYAAAIREAIDQSMEADANVIVIGEGVPDPKTIFGTTAGLYQKYGKSRVFDMPLSENGLTGICIGAALTGMRPIMVHQRIDFALLSMDQLVNNAAKWHYMFDGKASVPMVVRMIIGRGWGQGPQHSQSLHAMFAQVPGLKVVMPTTAHDAKGMMISAIEDNNPVIFIEHRWLHNVVDHVPEDYYRTPIGKARLLHEGNAVTVAAFSYMAMEALEAARALSAKMGITIDVLDMRSARPLDVGSVIYSVQKTGHLIVADTAFQSGGISGELICQVTEKAFKSLKSAPVRITLPDFPVPTSHFMTNGFYPDPRTIVETIIDILNVDRKTDGYLELCSALLPRGNHDTPSRDFVGPF